MAKKLKPAHEAPTVAPAAGTIAIHIGISDKDRSAIAMRFFQDKSLREVGDAMGVSEEAAQKRVTRAIEKLRGVFFRRGVHAAFCLAARRARNSAGASMTMCRLPIFSERGRLSSGKL